MILASGEVYGGMNRDAEGKAMSRDTQAILRQGSQNKLPGTRSTGCPQVDLE